MSEDTDKTWPFWTDVLGNLIYPGDYVAISTINGRSPQLVIAQVERINRVNSRGEEITSAVREMGKWKNAPSCSITARPIIDARDFTRWGNYFNPNTKTRAVTYQIPANIIRIELPKIEEAA